MFNALVRVLFLAFVERDWYKCLISHSVRTRGSIMYHRRHVIRGLLSTSAIAVISVAGAPSKAAEDAGPIVAAAASMRFALSEAAELFTRETGMPLRLNFGSSGNLSRQIRQGAPYQLFLSADENYALAIARDGHTLGSGTLYARGQLVMFAPKGSPVGIDGHLSGIGSALERGDLLRFAIANPEHAPYGRAAREALSHAGIWEAIQPKLVLGENVSQAAQFAATGSCEGGLIAHALARVPAISTRGKFVLVSENLYQPLHQRMVLLRGAKTIARAFYDFLQSEKASEIVSRHGFTRPEEF